GEGDLIHGSNESYRFCDGRIIADFGELFRPSLGEISFISSLYIFLCALTIDQNSAFLVLGSTKTR
ncbi:MAG: hypothetical protein CMK73_02340, partial [Pseudomonadales bacterium]|nr:hypothetical protein [Pseudomonadales bacterium]